MSCFDPEIYNYENLTDEDKLCVDELYRVKADILCEDTIDEYLAGHTGGKITDALLKELFAPFVDMLREKVDWQIQDLIVGMIEGYEKQQKSP